MTGRPAAFLDRDGTNIEDVGYLRTPADLRLLPGAAAAVKRLNDDGLAVVVVTNQSGIARGLLSLTDYQAGERRLDELLAREGARLDGHYACPHLPEITGPCECRKPGPLLYQRAADQLRLALDRSWWVGDRIRDVLPAAHFGGRGILLSGPGGESDVAIAAAHHFDRAADLAQAAELILRTRS